MEEEYNKVVNIEINGKLIVDGILCYDMNEYDDQASYWFKRDDLEYIGSVGEGGDTVLVFRTKRN